MTRLRPMAVDGGAPRWAEAFPALQAEGLGLVDVGARDGFHPAFNEIAPLAHLVGFEPDASECRRLEARAGASARFRSIRWLPVALGEADGERPLYFCRSPGASSLYAPDRRFLDRFPDASRFDVTDTRTVTVRALDSLVAEGGLPSRIGFLKVDTQGSELQILRGARRVLEEQAVAVEVEVEFAPMYSGQPLFRDLDAFLAECGFSLFGLRRFHWVRKVSGTAAEPSLNAGQLIFGEALYLKDPLGGAGGRISASWQAEALVQLALLFDLHDVALELLGSPALGRLVDREAVTSFIAQRSARLTRPKNWRGRLGRLGAVYLVLRRWPQLKGLFSFSQQYEASWARADADFHSRLRDGGR